jgi:O-antigen/teichoic acid export membrane protein
VWDVERFNYYRSPQARDIFSNVFRIISIFLISIALGISIFAEPAIRIMSTPEFHAATGDVPILVVASIFSCLVLFQNFSFLVSSNTKRITANNYIAMAVITVLNLAFIPVWGHLGAAIALMLTMIFQFFLTKRTAAKLYDMNIQARWLVLPLTVGATGFVLANHILDSEILWMDLTIKAMVYVLCLAVNVWLLWRDESMRPLLSALLKPIAARLPGVAK